MQMNRILGLVILAVGVGILIFAYHSTDAPLEKLSNSLTGRYSDETMWYFAGGLAAVVGGALLATIGRRR